MSDQQDALDPQLLPVPEQLVSTRLALHRLAEQVISPAREQATGRIGLRSTPGGFGTPVFAEGIQIRVLGGQLIVQQAGRERSAPITTLADMAKHVGRELLARPVTDTVSLNVDPGASAFLGNWYGFGASVLEALLANANANSNASDGDGARERLEPSLVQLWPEHFDIALEFGAERDGQRAAYGASPGDEQHPEPYLYVAPWNSVPPGELWRATAFAGAELPYVELLKAENRRETALTFFGERLAALTGNASG
jgi:hypothetical protein